MALTRDFRDTILIRVQKEPKFAEALLCEAATLLLNGDPETAKLILRDLLNSTIGFEQLATKIHTPSKSLHRMLSPRGNPTMNSLSAIFNALRKALKLDIKIKTFRHA